MKIIRWKLLFIICHCLYILIGLFWILARLNKSSHNAKNSQQAYYDEYCRHKMATFANLRLDSVDIVFVGTSLTERFPLDEIIRQPHVVNRGIGGNTTHHILQRIGTIARDHPNCIYLEMGINDLIQGLSIDSILHNWNLVIDTIITLSPKTMINIESLLPVGSKYDTIQKKIIATNERLKVLAAAHNLRFIDIYAALAQDERLPAKYSVDELHINGIAYQHWAIATGLQTRFLR